MGVATGCNKHEQQGMRIAILEDRGLGEWLMRFKSIDVADLMVPCMGFDQINSILKEFEKSQLKGV